VRAAKREPVNTIHGPIFEGRTTERGQAGNKSLNGHRRVDNNSNNYNDSHWLTLVPAGHSHWRTGESISTPAVGLPSLYFERAVGKSSGCRGASCRWPRGREGSSRATLVMTASQSRIENERPTTSVYIHHPNVAQ
jgi:hypothetical protein